MAGGSLVFCVLCACSLHVYHFSFIIIVFLSLSFALIAFDSRLCSKLYKDQFVFFSFACSWNFFRTVFCIALIVFSCCCFTIF